MSEIRQVFHECGFDAPQPEGRLPEALVYSVARTFNYCSREFTQLYQRSGLTPASYNLLMLLQRGVGVKVFTQHKLGELLMVSESSLTGLIDRLERKGWVRRVPGQDRRSKVLQITPKGVQLIEKIWPAHVALAERLTK